MKLIGKFGLAVSAMLIMGSVSAQSFLDAGRANYDGTISDNAEASLLLDADINPLDSVSSASMNVKFDAIKYLFDNLPSGGGASSLDGLSDVNSSGAQSGDVLTFNGSVWAPTAPSGGSGGIDQATSEVWVDQGGFQNSDLNLFSAQKSLAHVNEGFTETYFDNNPCISSEGGYAFLTSYIDEGATSGFGNDGAGEGYCLDPDNNLFWIGVKYSGAFADVVERSVTAVIFVESGTINASLIDLAGDQATIDDLNNNDGTNFIGTDSLVANLPNNRCFIVVDTQGPSNGVDYGEVYITTENSVAINPPFLAGYLFENHHVLYKDQARTQPIDSASECKAAAEGIMNSSDAQVYNYTEAGVLNAQSYWFRPFASPLNVN